MSALRERAVELGETVGGSPELASEVAEFTQNVTDDADGVNDELVDTKFGDFEAVAAVWTSIHPGRYSTCA